MDYRAWHDMLINFQQERSSLRLEQWFQQLTETLADASMFLMDADGRLAAHTELGDEAEPDMEDELMLEMGLLPEALDEFTRTIELVWQGRVQGRLWVSKPDPFSAEEDFILRASCCLLSFLLREQRQEEGAWQQELERQAAAAMQSLTPTEQKMAQHVLTYLQAECGSYPVLPEGLVVTSHLADEVGTARSIVVNALAKMQSASVVESRSLGPKGTWVRITNSAFIQKLQSAIHTEKSTI